MILISGDKFADEFRPALFKTPFLSIPWEMHEKATEVYPNTCFPFIWVLKSNG